MSPSERFYQEGLRGAIVRHAHEIDALRGEVAQMRFQIRLELEWSKAEEREACAKLADSMPTCSPSEIAQAIRARGEK